MHRKPLTMRVVRKGKRDICTRCSQIALERSKLIGTKDTREKTPTRKATIARTEGKQMAKVKKAAPAKAPAKKGKK